MDTTYQKYIPEKAIPFVQFLIETHNFTLKIVTQRQTKHGDFRKLPNGQFQITVNNNLNKYPVVANGPKLTSKVGTANNRTGPLVDTNIYGLHSDQIGCQISFFLRRQTLV